MTGVACEHPEDQRYRDRNRRGYLKCKLCRESFPRPRRKLPDHGTPEGYSRHRRIKAGNWAWPACTPCQEAQRNWLREYNHRPDAIRMRKLRGSARLAALNALQRLYPAEYRKAYIEESAKRGLVVTNRMPPPPEWEQVLVRMLKVAGVDVNDLTRSVQGGWATTSEREVFRCLRQLRFILAESHKLPARTLPED